MSQALMAFFKHEYPDPWEHRRLCRLATDSWEMFENPMLATRRQQHQDLIDLYGEGVFEETEGL